ncbi:MAG: hypothetical protein ACOC42_02295 [Halobacteriota archaeon]
MASPVPTTTPSEQIGSTGLGERFTGRWGALEWLAGGTERDRPVEHVSCTGFVGDTRGEATAAGPPIPWVWLVVLATGLWLAYIAVGELLGDLSLYLFAAPAWGLLPVSLYFDARDLRERTGWPSAPWLYVLPAIIPVIGSISGVIYLLRRYRRTR